MIHFVLYEYLKEMFKRYRVGEGVDEKANGFHLEEYMVASAFSKTVACCVAYPHGIGSASFFLIAHHPKEMADLVSVSIRAFLFEFACQIRLLVYLESNSNSL